MEPSSLRPAAFLDRDGVINRDVGYIGDRSRFEFLPGVAEAIRLLNEAGYWVFVVTNQSGIARGLFTEDQFLELTDWMLAELASQGARIDRVFYCPHHPEEGQGEYRVDCDCRKPRPGMILEAIQTFPVTKEGSFLIGDSERDVQAAAEAGIRGWLAEPGRLLELVHELLAERK